MNNSAEDPNQKVDFPIDENNSSNLDPKKVEKDLENLSLGNPLETETPQIIEEKNISLDETTKTNEQPTITNEESNTQGSTAKLFIIISFLVGISFVIIFYGLLLWAVLTGGEISNPLFTVLGIETIELKSTLELITNSIFGITSLILLVSVLFKIYLAILSRKDSEKRKQKIINIGISFLIFLTVCGTWIGLFLLISKANNSGFTSFDNSMILTKPQNVIGISTPISIEFNIGTKIYQKIEPKFVKQINWDFDGDGVYDASGPKVTHRFLTKGENNGKYVIEANVLYFSPSEKKDRNFITTKEIIVVNEAILGVLEADVVSGNSPLRVSFSSEKSVDSDGEIVFYEWDLDGDGEYEVFGEKMQNTEKLYSKIGEYLVKLRITGTNNDIDIVEKKITVTESGTNLRAEITSSDPLEGFAPLSFTLDGTQSFTREGEIIKYEWYVEGENTSVSSRRIQRKFYQPGEYEISLTVENETGEKNKKTIIVKVKEIPKTQILKIKTTPKTNEDEILTGALPFKVTFDSSKSEIKDAIEWQWDFENDGIIDEFEPSVKHIFKTAGLFDVELKVINAKGEQLVKTIKVQVTEIGTKAIIKALPSSGEVPFTTRFDGSGSITDDGEIVDYIWEFPGQDPIHYGAQISYDFKKIGIFPIKLTVLTTKSNVATTEIIISARSVGLKSDFSVIPETGIAPLKIEFNPTKSSGMITEYYWQFGDGEESSREFMPTHIFKQPGEYEVKLKVTDSKGVVSESSKTINVLDK